MDLWWLNEGNYSCRGEETTHSTSTTPLTNNVNFKLHHAGSFWRLFSPALLVATPHNTHTRAGPTHPVTQRSLTGSHITTIPTR
jgi:hypothetical protein